MHPQAIQKKVEILTKYFGIYGVGNFDISKSEVAQILSLLYEDMPLEVLDGILLELYERLSQERLG
jgi:hypothetical protein